jgi:hypothetical protein
VFSIRHLTVGRNATFFYIVGVDRKPNMKCTRTSLTAHIDAQQSPNYKTLSKKKYPLFTEPNFLHPA